MADILDPMAFETRDKCERVVKDAYNARVMMADEAVKRGRLQVMVGGDDAIYNEVRSVLLAVGHKVGDMRPVGSGTIAKLVHNYRR